MLIANLLLGAGYFWNVYFFYALYNNKAPFDESKNLKKNKEWPIQLEVGNCACFLI